MAIDNFYGFKKPLVSIITPTYNSMEYIKNTYNCIASQTYQSWEWVVTDDYSSDGTYEVLLSLAEVDSRIKLFRTNKNSGAAVARNISLKNSRGEFVAFIDSDDIWASDKLSKQINFMITANVDFSFTAYQLVNSRGVCLNKTVDTHIEVPVDYESMLRKKATLGCSTVMIRKRAFEDLSMPLIRTGQDYGMWLKLLKTGAKAYHFNEVLTQYRILPNSISRNKLKKAKRQWEIYREIENLPFLKSIECFCFYAWRAVFRK